MSEPNAIKAFAQILWRWPLIGIIRAGIGTDGYGKDYQFAVVFRRKVFQPVAVFYALVATPPECETCEWHQRLQRAHQRAATEIMASRGIRVEWERYKKTNSKIVRSPFRWRYRDAWHRPALALRHIMLGKSWRTEMRKDIPSASAHSVHTGRDGKNQIDQAKVRQLAHTLMTAGESGAAEVVHLETTEIATKGAKRRSRVVIEVELPD